MKGNYICAISAILIWSTMAAAVKILLASLPSLEALAISSFFAFLVLLVLNLWNSGAAVMRHYPFRDYLAAAALGFVGLFLYSALYYYGLSQLSSQEACILNYLWPIMLVAFSCIILKEQMTVMKGAAMLCSFAGIVILSTGSAGGSNGNRALGMTSCVAAAACYGLFSVLNKKADKNQKITMMVIWLTTALCALTAGLMVEAWVPVSGVQWLGLLWLGAACDAAGYLLWALALKGEENTAAIANLAYLTPFLSLVVSAVLLKEKIQVRMIVALVFIVGGILLQQVWKRVQSKRVVSR